MSATRTEPAHRLTGWRAAVIWLVAASGIVALALADVFNPDALIVLLIIAGATVIQTVQPTSVSLWLRR